MTNNFIEEYPNLDYLLQELSRGNKVNPLPIELIAEDLGISIAKASALIYKYSTDNRIGRNGLGYYLKGGTK